ncbi:MAG: hypothetical protein OXI87_09515, partial [Albidovulum sp.]|nr:hypothetical protein [Albidovulum sp.]
MKSSNSELARQLAERDERIAELLEKIRELGDEIKLLKNLSRRPDPKPRGEAGKGPPGPGKPERPGGGARNKGRGPRKPGGSLRRRTQRVPAENVPDGAVRGGFEYRTVRDVAFFAEEVVYELEVWKLPGGGRLVAKMPPGVASGREQYGLGLKAWIVMMQRKGQSTAGRIAEILNDIGLDISRRSVVRIPAEDGAGVVAESEEVLRAGMDCASWISVDDTGARHGRRTATARWSATIFSRISGRPARRAASTFRSALPPARPASSSTTPRSA